jgi:signal transduction histidine kinase
VSGSLEELLAYVGLGADDRARLRALHPVLAPQFPAIAERFYEAVWANPGAAAVLESPAQVERLRLTLIDWMTTGLLGPHDEAFYAKRSRIGRRHVAIGLAQHYMFTAMSVVRTAYVDHIAAALPPAEATAMTRAVSKLLDVELAIMARHYHIDSEERALAREREVLADRIAAMQTMSSGLAHEVRNPLNAAQLQLELLERRLRRDGHDGRLLEPAELARHELARLTALLDEFLAFARPPELSAKPYDVAAILRQVTLAEALMAERAGATLALVEPEPLVVEVDGPKLHQAVQNLVRNAIEAAGAGGVARLALIPGATRFVVRVTDDGPGIPAHVQPRIFEPFFTTKESGTGLGMAIVHSLVALHGGAIDLDTGPGGTRVDLVIPRRPPVAPPAEGAEGPAAAERGAQPPRSPPR